jgi:hypothetical protein
MKPSHNNQKAESSPHEAKFSIVAVHNDKKSNATTTTVGQGNHHSKQLEHS